MSVAGLILAAGRSSRMGSPKALLHVGGREIIWRLIDVYAEAKLDPIIVVASGPTLTALRDEERIELVPGDADAAMVDSVARGIEALPPTTTAAVIQPVDAPFTTEPMIASLLDGWAHTSRVLCHQGRAGHPVLVVRSLFHDIEQRPDGGLRALLGAHDVELVEWADSSVLADLDTPTDVARWRGDVSTSLH